MHITVKFAALAAAASLLAACTVEDYAAAQQVSTNSTVVTTPGTTFGTTVTPLTTTTVSPATAFPGQTTTTTFATVPQTTLQPLNTTTTYQTISQPINTQTISSLPSFTIRGTSFGQNSDNLLSSARGQLDDAANSMRSSGGQYSIVGYASTEGDDSYNQRLSERRAASVAAYLVGKGVPSSALIVAGAGETTQFGSDLESNRRVEISPRSSTITGTSTVMSQPIITTTQPLVVGNTAVPIAPSIVIAQ